MIRRRSRPRAYLALARSSNLPTVWTNVLAGIVLASGGVSWPIFGLLGVSMSVLYTGGMFLNDAFDAAHDATHRPDRPIPAREVRRAETFVIGFVLLAAGVALVAPAARAAVPWTVALAACILYYDWRHKTDANAPVVMGACRALVYCASAAAAGAVAPAVAVWAVIVALYVVGLTLVAKYGGERLGGSVAWLIAGICVLDAVAIATRGAFGLALLALAGMPATLLAQRWVRGT